MPRWNIILQNRDWLVLGNGSDTMAETTYVMVCYRTSVDGRPNVSHVCADDHLVQWEG